jgi:hypothetical protein
MGMMVTGFPASARLGFVKNPEVPFNHRENIGEKKLMCF